MRPTTTCSYGPLDFIKPIWVIHYWVIDADTPIMVTTPTIVNDEGLTTPPIINDLPTETLTNEREFEAAIDAADTYLSTTYALVVMNPLEHSSLMRFTDVVSQENITSKAGTLIDMAASLNFASKKFLNAN